MDKIIYRLSDNEEQILETLWNSGESLSRSEIIEQTENKTWKSSSIHILLNQLLEKEAIFVDGFTKTGKSYGRTYAPSLTKAEHDIMQLKVAIDTLHPNETTLKDFISLLIASEILTEESLDELAQLIEDKKGKK